MKLIEVNPEKYKKLFPTNPHPFVSESFIELNKSKTEKIIRLVEDTDHPGIGLIAGVSHGIIKSPFSAPFGGFHYRKDNMYISEIDNFFSLLKEYILSKELKGIEITLPPNIYHLTFNSKVVNTLIRNVFEIKIPEITNWISLDQFQGKFTQRNSREYFRQAQRNGLKFDLASDQQEELQIFKIIRENRTKFGRPIYLSYKDLKETSYLWPTDFFKVYTVDNIIVASAIFYRYHPEICYAVFWGDSEIGRPLRAMDYLTYYLWSYYKELGFKYIDLGISTESGKPNEGLLRFKESHEATSSLRYTFVWKKDMCK